jgi:hypothetical protein
MRCSTQVQDDRPLQIVGAFRDFFSATLSRSSSRACCSIRAACLGESRRSGARRASIRPACLGESRRSGARRASIRPACLGESRRSVLRALRTQRGLGWSETRPASTEHRPTQSSATPGGSREERFPPHSPAARSFCGLGLVYLEAPGAALRFLQLVPKTCPQRFVWSPTPACSRTGASSWRRLSTARRSTAVPALRPPRLGAGRRVDEVVPHESIRREGSIRRASSSGPRCARRC